MVTLRTAVVDVVIATENGIIFRKIYSMDIIGNWSCHSQYHVGSELQVGVLLYNQMIGFYQLRRNLC
jgi:hypothetical protein